jgi:hypothetical protein
MMEKVGVVGWLNCSTVSGRHGPFARLLQHFTAHCTSPIKPCPSRSTVGFLLLELIGVSADSILKKYHPLITHLLVPEGSKGIYFTATTATPPFLTCAYHMKSKKKRRLGKE